MSKAGIFMPISGMPLSREAASIAKLRRTGTLAVEPGSVMLLFPGEWHRYRPNQESGWDEYWVSFGGQHIAVIRSRGFRGRSRPKPSSA